jgi:addiction module HigA family antidote
LHSTGAASRPASSFSVLQRISETDYAGDEAMCGRLANVHPGEVLLEEFMKPMGLSQNGLARALGVPPRRINEIVQGKRAITADSALRLARYFGTSEGFWMGLQADFDVEEAREHISHQLEQIRAHAA